MTVFKAYDVRGVYPRELDEALARRIGSAFAQLVSAGTLVVGRDMRTMAESVTDAFVEGATLAGADVIRIGLASTPMTYYAIGSLGVDGGAQVTASHNPPEYIGLKFCREGCVPVSRDTGIAELERLATGPEPAPAKRRGTVRDHDVMDGYVDHLAAFGAADVRPLKIVVDVANAMAGHALPRILERLPVDAEVLFGELDGTFPNHPADPLKKENLRALEEAVTAGGAVLGLAFDGDADRCVFVDHGARAARSDLVTAAFAQDFLARAPGAAVVYDLRSSRSVPEAVRAAGGRPVRERVGHSFIKATMRREDAVLGGELSGHYYFRDNYVSDSGEIAMVAMLSLISRTGRDLRELVSAHDRYPSTGEINFHADDVGARLQELRERFADARIDELDGVTVAYPDWWCNVRPSNTEPLLRLNLEADDEDILRARRAELEGILGTPEG